MFAGNTYVSTGDLGTRARACKYPASQRWAASGWDICPENMRTAGTARRTGAQLLLCQRVAIQAHKINMFGVKTIS